jgi:hypothetical protein
MLIINRSYTYILNLQKPLLAPPLKLWRHAVGGVGEAFHSVFKLFTGLAIAALIDWKLTVANVINTEHATVPPKIHHDIWVRYSYF